MPVNTATPSRRFRQTKISDSLNGFHKPSGGGGTTDKKSHEHNTENTKPRTDTVSYPTLPSLAQDKTIELSDSTDEEKKETDGSDSEAPRKVARTKNNTSPSKQQLMREMIASRTSFSSTSTIVDETTPSTKFQGLKLQTPSTMARMQAETIFNSVTPVKRLNLRQATRTGSSSVPAKTSDPNNPFLTPALSLQGEDTPSRSRQQQDDIVDAEKEVLALLREAGVNLAEPYNSKMVHLLQRITNKQKGYVQSRDLNRTMLKRSNDEKAELLKEVERLNDRVESSRHIQQADRASLSSQQIEIQGLRKENDDLKLQVCQMEGLEMEKEMLEEKLKQANKVLEELAGDYIP
ncbi:hypothetical protein H072_5192 [Dactylellina haptotyla CBS 200.50]|uniref:Uncharacterized protein n=1 Tax=Dactylellina haptotyla (strain CBS 200.50) TaxID=1284197 RepID=S8C023_DACHA|nr:hypothetical protein H072_5192 [Dactylellina haptotyla CBS 200.50]